MIVHRHLHCAIKVAVLSCLCRCPPDTNHSTLPTRCLCTPAGPPPTHYSPHELHTARCGHYSSLWAYPAEHMVAVPGLCHRSRCDGGAGDSNRWSAGRRVPGQCVPTLPMATAKAPRAHGSSPGPLHLPCTIKRREHMAAVPGLCTYPERSSAESTWPQSPAFAPTLHYQVHGRSNRRA